MRKMLKKLGVVIPSAVLTLLMAVGFSTPAFAYVELEAKEEPAQVIEEEEPTEEEKIPFTIAGNGEVEDNITDDSSKEFFTVKTKGGNTFFLVIDRARNSENVYMKIPEIARALDVQGVQTPQVQMAKKKRSRTKNKWQDSTIRSILKNPLYIGKCTLTLAKAKRELEAPAIVSKTEFQKAQKKLESTRLPSRKKARKKPNLLFKKIYDKESGKGLLCRTSEDESQQIYSFDKGYRCFSGKAPFIESEKIFREILLALEKEKMQAAHIDRVLDLNPEKVKQCMDAGLLQYRKRANEIVAHLMAKDDERTAVYRQYEQGSILLEQVEEYEHQYQVAVQKQEAAFKKVMLAVNDIEKAFSHGNPWLMKFRAISIPEKLERTHLKEWLDHVWIVDFEQVEVILQESEWKRFFPEEWLNNGEEDCNGKKE